VKTKQFGKYQYIGDPANTVRIFNELEVDELCFLDIKAARTRSGPDFDVLRDIVTECFMPLCYGAGSVRDIEKVIKEGKASAAAIGSLAVFSKKEMGVLINFPNLIEFFNKNNMCQ